MSDAFKPPKFEVPAEMRDLATKSVEQTKRAFESFMGATHQAAGSVQENAMTATRQAVGYAEQNVKAALDHAHALVQAKGLEDFMKLQADFMKNQMVAFQDQMKTMGKVAEDSVKPKKG